MAFKPRQPDTESKQPDDHPFDIRVYVATPAYDGRVLTDYAISIAESAFLAPIHGIMVEATVMGNGAFIEIARNHFVRMFLETDCTHLFFIDADLRWEARMFIELARANKPICAAAYRKRQDPEEYPVRFVNDTNGYMLIQDGWIMCDRVASGFLCIRRDVIEKMVDASKWIKSGNDKECPSLFYTKTEPSGDGLRFIGEDFAFCDDYVRIFKEPIPVWPDATFTHGSRFVGNYHKWLNKRAEEEGVADAT